MSREMNEWLTLTAQRDGYPSTGYVLKPEPGNRNRNWTNDEGNHLLRSMTAQFQAAQVRLGFVKRTARRDGRCTRCAIMPDLCGSRSDCRMEDVSRMLGHAKIATTQKYYIHHFKKQNLERDRAIDERMSDCIDCHRPAAARPAEPMRDLCEIDGEAIEI